MAKRGKYTGLTTDEKIARLEKNHKSKTPWYRKSKAGKKKRYKKIAAF